MPVVRHRLNFSELVIKAASQVKKQKNREAKYTTAIGQHAKRKASNDPASLERSRSALVKTHSKALSQLLVFSSLCRDILCSNVFQAATLIFMILAFGALSAETSKDVVSRLGGDLRITNLAIDIFFMMDGILKMFVLISLIVVKNDIGERFKYGNLFSESGFVEIVFTSLSLSTEGSEVSLWCRLLLLLFISTFGLQHVPHIDVLLSGIGLGVASLMSTWLLLSVVFFIYAACALSLFSRNDPFHFGSIAMSMWTFFELASLDNWEKVMYINMYGCDVSPYYYYMQDELNGTAYANTNTVSVESYGEMFLPVCSSPQPRPMLSAFVFITFVILCGFILVSLTVAAVTSGINNRIDQIQAANIEEATDIVEVLDDDQLNEQFEDKFDPALVFLMVKQIWKQAEDYAHKLKARGRKRNTVIHPGMSSQRDIEAVRAKYQNERSLASGGLSFRNVTGAFGIQKQSMVMRNMVGSVKYKLSFAITVLLAATLEILVLQEKQRPTAIEVFQAFLQLFFSVDIYVKIVAHYPDYMNYFSETWNRFDFIVVILTWVPSFTAIAHSQSGEYFGLLRVLHILRVLRLLTWISNLNIMMKAIAGSMRALVYVILLMCLFFYHFAIAGVFLFSKNDPYHFGNILKSFVTLFQICTLDNWADIARTNMYGCDLYGYDTGKKEYDALCEEPIALGWFAAWFFVVFIVLGVMVLISLFVGIIITSMELLKEGVDDEREMRRKIKDFQEKYKIIDRDVENMLEVFEIVDRTKNAKLTFTEIQPVLELVIPTEVDQVQLFMKVDSDKSGQIDFAEFLGIVMELLPFYKANQDRAEKNVAAKTTSRKADRIGRRRASITNGIIMSQIARLQIPPSIVNADASSKDDASSLPSPSGSADGSCLQSVDENSLESGCNKEEDQSLGDVRATKNSILEPQKENEDDENSVTEVDREDGKYSAREDPPEDEYSCESTFAREEGIAGVDYLWLK